MEVEHTKRFLGWSRHLITKSKVGVTSLLHQSTKKNNPLNGVISVIVCRLVSVKYLKPFTWLEFTLRFLKQNSTASFDIPQTRQSYPLLTWGQKTRNSRAYCCNFRFELAERAAKNIASVSLALQPRLQWPRPAESLHEAHKVTVSERIRIAGRALGERMLRISIHPPIY